MSFRRSRPIDINDRVEVMTKDGCRYQGFLECVDHANNCFRLNNVRNYGTEDRDVEFHQPAQSKLYKELNFEAPDVKDVKRIESRARDPAIVWRSRDIQERPSFEFQSYQPEPNRYYQRRDYHHRFNDRHNNGFRHQKYNWGGVTGLMGEGRFPLRNPGCQGNMLEDFDFEKGIQEFNKLKLDDSSEETPKPDEKESDNNASAYDKQKSFFDHLKADAVEQNRVRRTYSYGQNPNFETFGASFVKQLKNPGHRHVSRQPQFRPFNTRSNQGRMMGFKDLLTVKPLTHSQG